jgi:metallo-beta-lactamase family protein
MKITPLGAAGGEVTGSAYFVETDQAKILVDCGLFQGGKDADTRNHASLSGPASRLDAVVLTHGHLDHTGRLPILSKLGYSGPIFATPATIELTSLILRDAAKLQAQDIERVNRKRQRAGEPPVEPLYTAEETECCLGQFRPVAYHHPTPVAPGITAEFVEAGHMLGSACIQLRIKQGPRERRVVFSGDLGPKDSPILKEFERFKDAEIVFLESTYGDHDHRGFEATAREFFEIVRSAVDNRGKILVPTFAVGRAQVLTMLLAWAFRNHVLPPFPVYLDSPMAIEAWKIYRAHHELYDEQMTRFLKEGNVAHDLETLTMSVTSDDSRKINDVPGPCLVMAGAGMCTGGRILHHLKQNLWRPETHVVIVGYQAIGSVGRMLVDGAEEVRLFGETIAVKARVHTLGGFSAHAGQADLLHWFAPLAKSKPRVFLTHGEDIPRKTLAKELRERFHVTCHLPKIGEEITF